MSLRRFRITCWIIGFLIVVCHIIWRCVCGAWIRWSVSTGVSAFVWAWTVVLFGCYVCLSDVSVGSWGDILWGNVCWCDVLWWSVCWWNVSWWHVGWWNICRWDVCRWDVSRFNIGWFDVCCFRWNIANSWFSISIVLIFIPTISIVLTLIPTILFRIIS